MRHLEPHLRTPMMFILDVEVIRMSMIESLLQKDPYSMEKKEKESMLSEYLIELTRHHYACCPEYHKLLDGFGIVIDELQSYYDIPMIPVRLFKEYELLSVPREEVKKVMTSSGTSGQAVSKIFLDLRNVKEQSVVLTQLISSFIGGSRLPMIVLDTKLVKKDRKMYSARGAGITGFSMYGRDIFYALDENMELDVEGICEYLEKYKNETILMFGYTYMIWQYVICEMERRKISFNVNEAVLFHVGGWKKLKDQAVDTITYNKRIQAAFGNVRIHNYYGMAEQLGSIYIECEHGHMHCSNYSDIIIRNTKDFSVQPLGEKGLMELVSVLPTSYPGHVLLTEDEGVILGEDDCPCGRKGKYFKILGRIKNAEVRGCSDTYEKP